MEQILTTMLGTHVSFCCFCLFSPKTNVCIRGNGKNCEIKQRELNVIGFSYSFNIKLMFLLCLLSFGLNSF